jgi:cytochrome c-type biogenesis protein CcmH
LKFQCLAPLLFFLVVGGAAAEDIESRARYIEENLIAPCCWSQPVAQHYSAAAEQIKQEVRQMLAEGKTDREILDHYASTYGERILASPRPEGFNLLVWILPWVSLGMGALMLILFLRRWRQRIPVLQQAPAGGMIDSKYSERMEQELRDLE